MRKQEASKKQARNENEIERDEWIPMLHCSVRADGSSCFCPHTYTRSLVSPSASDIRGINSLNHAVASPGLSYRCTRGNLQQKLHLPKYRGPGAGGASIQRPRRPVRNTYSIHTSAAAIAIIASSIAITAAPSSPSSQAC